jgi:V8-like Glu-specific endopeptidase
VRHFRTLRSATLSHAVLLGASAIIAGCADRSEKIATTDEPVVYGNDDRQDVYAYADSAWAARAAEFTAAMMSTGAVNRSNPNDIRFNSGTLREDFGVCPDERFANQITAASCSATLIAPDLVITAGHCISSSSCSGNLFVFDYYMTSASQLHAVTSDDVYSCRQVVAHALSGGLDYAIVRLDRTVTGRAPAPVDPTAAALPVGTPLIVNGYGSGLPLKIDNGATVRDSRASSQDYFIANLDTFGGNSGSGVFRSDTGRLIGILVRGETDYVNDGSCSRVNRCTNTGCRGEDSTYAYRAIAALCAAGPNPTLCACGDGTCDGGAGETPATCPADCGSECGDGVCSGGETSSTCPEDCGTCGNGACDGGETSATCCIDCACPGDNVCNQNQCVPPPGRGDTCADPLPITASGTQTLTGTTATAQDDFAGACVGGDAPDRVYRFTLTRRTTIDARVTGYDTGLYLRNGCGTGSELACNDDATPPGGLGSRIQRALNAGTYYLVVDGYGTSAGAYTLSVAFSP